MAKDQRRNGGANGVPMFYVKCRTFSLPRIPAHCGESLFGRSPLADAIVSPKELHAWATPLRDINDITQITSPARSSTLSELAVQP